jgi:hypothetical protein
MKRSFQKFVAKLEAIGLHQKLERRALAFHISLRDLYEGRDKAPSIAAARRDAYLWLMKDGKGLNEVARLFDRAPSGVARLLLRGKT